MIFGRRYRVTEKIGTGGMAEVYKAVDEVLGRTVAVKVLHSHYASDPAFVARFRQEAQAAANLSHPGIVNIYDWGQDDSTYYIVMEYVRGEDLKSLVERGPIDAVKVAEYAAQVCAALSVAHGYDIIHRDIKPHNIVLTPDGTVKVMDFGIARAGNTQMTQTGSVLGTAHYVSPEQAQGRTLAATSDLYSLGVVLYELTTGRVPFDADTPVAVALKHVNEDPVPPRELNPAIPSGLEAVILRAMRKNPADRYASAEEMRRDLTRVASGRTVETPPPSRSDETSVMPVVGGAADRPGSSRVRPVPRRRNPWPWVALVALLLVAGLAAAWAFGVFDTEPMIVVPDLVGMTELEAQEALESVELNVGPIDYRHSEEPSGTIIAHDPSAGSEVAVGSEVELTISRGIEQFSIPDLVGLTESEALAELRKAGFELNTIERKFSGEPDGVVIEQTPAAGEQAPTGALVTLVISKGIELRKVPSVTGKSLADARSILEAEGFKVSVVEEFSDSVDKGLVISQSPDGNASLEAGGQVTVRVSKGRDTVQMPNVIDKMEDEAVSELEDLGFDVDVEYQDSPDDGIVITQDPVPGFDAERGQRVIIYVGQLPEP